MQGWIALENGSVFFGDSFGYQDTVEGELVFNTSMTGYQEALIRPQLRGSNTDVYFSTDWKLRM